MRSGLDEDRGLRDQEGTFLSLVLRLQPTTAYQVAKVYDESPVSNFKTYKGKIYPLIDRLEKRGLLSRHVVPGDGRGAEQLRCTEAGQVALRDWVQEIRPDHLLLDDPMRTKVQLFDLLSREEQVRWVLDAKEQLHAKLADIQAYERMVEVPFKEFVHDNAVQSIRARMDWLDRMLFSLSRD